MINELENLIDESQKILITAHIGPDADSLCSSLLLASTLRENYAAKDIVVCMDEDYSPLAFLKDYSSIRFAPLADSVAKYQPDLLIILDANNIARCTRDPEPARNLVKEAGIKLLVIDHHEPVDIEVDALYINQKSPAVTQDVYEICFKRLSLKKPDGYAQTAMIGLYSDTGGFTYDNPRYADTFKMATELMNDGANTELAANQLTQYTKDGLEVLEELIKNINQVNDYTYTYISDEFYSKWQEDDRSADAIHEGFDIFLHNFIRNIEGHSWGFTIYPDPKAKSKTYRVSLRSLQGLVDVSAIARQLGGGGHKSAAGAKIECDSVEEALTKVKAAINSLK
ncbi:MAG TPA: DHH family phosphoesterase [Candidatus Saccharimonadales bacterium]|nr:DHH family phosphoesterase [Candidatus Saccharimonadales bacterium]